jgi:hypothetical protein
VAVLERRRADLKVSVLDTFMFQVGGFWRFSRSGIGPRRVISSHRVCGPTYRRRMPRAV